MKILFIGLGSIGQRHLRNILKKYKDAEIFALRKLKRNFELDNNNKIIGNNLIEKYGIREISRINEIKKFNIDTVFINSPSSMHLDNLAYFIKEKMNIFIEKPLSDKIEKAKIFLPKIKKNPNLKIMIGHQLRFNKCLIKIKSILKNNELGKICGANIYHGENLNNFHTYENYKKIYAAKKNLGGGVVLSQIHEIDYMTYLFGHPYSVYARGGKTSNLKIDVEDYVNVIFDFRDKNNIFSISMTLDYLQNPKKRELFITGTKGSLHWDYYNDIININFFNGVKKTLRFKLKNRNELFIREIEHFFDSFKKNKKIESTYFQAYKSLEIAEKIKKSIQTNKVIKLNKK